MEERTQIENKPLTPALSPHPMKGEGGEARRVHHHCDAARSPSPFAERGEKVAAGRMRGVATNADGQNPSPRPSPIIR